jgi:hypothetical protein
MRPTTINTLERLKKTDWFTRVGIKDTGVAMVVSSWQEAICRIQFEGLRSCAAHSPRD